MFRHASNDLDNPNSPYHIEEASPAVSDTCVSAVLVASCLAAPRNGDSTTAVGIIDERDVAFQILRSGAVSDLERTLVDGIRLLSDEQTPVPWTPTGPSFQSVIRFVGLDVDADADEDRLRALVKGAAHLLVPATKGRGRRYGRCNAAAFAGLVRSRLDELSHGFPVPRSGTVDRVSRVGLAILLRLPLSQLSRHKGAMDEVRARLADGRLTLGDTFRRAPVCLKEFKAARTRLIQVIEDHAAGDDPRPITLENQPIRKYAMEPLLDAAGVSDAGLREKLLFDGTVRRALTRVVAVVGTRRLGEPLKKAPLGLTFDDLLQGGEREALEAYHDRNPDGDAPGAARAAANEVSYLRRVMDRNGWTPTDEVEPTLLGEQGEAAIARGCSQNLRGDRNYLAAVNDRWIPRARAMIEIRKAGVTFDQRVRVGIKALGLSARAFADRFEVPYGTLLRYLDGSGQPTSHQLHLVRRMEKAFGLPIGDLTMLLGVVRGGRNNTARKTIKLANGRVMPLKRYLCYLPVGAIDWSEDRLRTAVEEAERRHYGGSTVNTIRQREVSRIAKAQEPLDMSAPIFREWEDLKTFKTGLSDSSRNLNEKWEWNSSRTVLSNENHMREFARWCARPVEMGGLGLPSFQISFILILNHQVVMKYVFYRSLRFSHLTLDGKELGSTLSGTEFHFLSFIKALLDPEYGWLAQSRDVVKAPEVIDVEFALERMSALDNEFKIEMPANPEVCQVMSAALVAAIDADWTGAVLNSRRKVSSLNGKVARHYRMIRDPHQLVKPILNHSHPIAVVLRSVKDALAHARPFTVCPMQHAKDYRNAVAMLLLATVVFRSETLRNMEYRSDGSGHLIRTATGYDVVVGADRFKNGFCQWLFGPSYRRRDYERALGDWKGLNNILDHYLDVCRPILLKGRKSDLLFPTGGSAESWSHPTFNATITNWTRMWCVRNERYGTGMTGILPWGPHCIRDIVATHIILHYPTEHRWELAANILCTGVELVRTRYAFVNSRRELAKANGMYNEAFAIGFGDEDLASLAAAA